MNSPGLTALILTVLAVCVITLCLALANLCLVFDLTDSVLFAIAHGAFYLSYVFLTFWLYQLGRGKEHLSGVMGVTAATLPFLIPFLVIGHFGCLVDRRRRIGRQVEQQGGEP